MITDFKGFCTSNRTIFVFSFYFIEYLPGIRIKNKIVLTTKINATIMILPKSPNTISKPNTLIVSVSIDGSLPFGQDASQSTHEHGRESCSSFNKINK